MDSAASSETVQGQESQQEFPIRKNATRSRSANRVVRRTFAFLRHQSLTLIWAEEKEKTRSFLIGSLSVFYAVVWLRSGRLEPAVHRTAMNPDPFGEGFNSASLLQMNFDHLLALCRQVKLRRAWNAAGVDEIQLRNIDQSFWSYNR